MVIKAVGVAVLSRHLREFSRHPREFSRRRLRVVAVLSLSVRFRSTALLFEFPKPLLGDWVAWVHLESREWHCDYS